MDEMYLVVSDKSAESLRPRGTAKPRFLLVVRRPSTAMNPSKASPPAGNPLSSFRRLGPCVYYLPTPSAESVSDTAGSSGANASSDHGIQPDLIILCTWMNAAPRHIAKYTAAYLSLY